jgi:hypothetical protein
MKPMKRVMSILLAALVLGAGPALPAGAAGDDCGALPSSAQKARTCNPQQQCLAQVEGALKGQALESARKDCQRLPTTGTCYGPETYNPQAECRDRQGGGKKKK